LGKVTQSRAVLPTSRGLHDSPTGLFTEELTASTVIGINVEPRKMRFLAGSPRSGDCVLESQRVIIVAILQEISRGEWLRVRNPDKNFVYRVDGERNGRSEHVLVFQVSHGDSSPPWSCFGSDYYSLSMAREESIEV
jgi:hypothetical protein